MQRSDDKEAIRALMLSARDGFAEKYRLSAGRLIESRLLALDEFRNATVLSTCVSKASEIDTQGITRAALCLGKRTLVPVIDRDNRRLVLSELADPDGELALGTFGILEPKPEFRRIAPLKQAEFALVPRIAWNLRRYRLGYGMAYYDSALRELESETCTLGLPYESQLLPRLLSEGHDVRVKMGD